MCVPLVSFPSTERSHTGSRDCMRPTQALLRRAVFCSLELQSSLKATLRHCKRLSQGTSSRHILYARFLSDQSQKRHVNRLGGVERSSRPRCVNAPIGAEATSGVTTARADQQGEIARARLKGASDRALSRSVDQCPRALLRREEPVPGVGAHAVCNVRTSRSSCRCRDPAGIRAYDPMWKSRPADCLRIHV
jgi:hypothetical protein